MASIFELAQAGVENIGGVDERVLACFDDVISTAAVKVMSTIRAKGFRSRGSGEEGAPEEGVRGRKRGGYHVYFVKVFKRPVEVVHGERVRVRRSLWRSDIHDKMVALRALLGLITRTRLLSRCR